VAAEGVAPTLALVAVSAEGVAPLADPTAAPATVAAIAAALPGSAVGDRPRGLALVPVAPAVQVSALGLGKVTAPATPLPDGISFHPATPGLWVAKGWALPRPAPALPPCQQGLAPR
jgi:hypothetical protein